jgi:hypothetical protein
MIRAQDFPTHELGLAGSRRKAVLRTTALQNGFAVNESAPRFVDELLLPSRLNDEKQETTAHETNLHNAGTINVYVFLIVWSE